MKKLLKLFFLFPIKKNRILFIAYSGKQYACNPKYISETMLRDEGDRIECIWAFCDPKEFSCLDERIKCVRYKSLSYLYYVLTAGIVVENAEGWSVLPKRPGQVVINTWHGGGAYKGVGLSRKDTSRAQDQNMLEKHKRVSLYLSSSKAFTRQTIRESFGFDGEVLECGMPRNDMLIFPDKEKMREVRQTLGLSEECRYILFAPTFRKDLDYGSDVDFGGLVQALERRFSGQWKVLYRHHYYQDCGNSSDSRLIDVSWVQDMQDLLLITDALLTDYSSSMWDFSFTYSPGFLFVPDLEEYEEEERAFYTPIETWPYDYAKTNDQLFELIRHYDEKAAAEKIRRHHMTLESCENGTATQTVCRYIKKVLTEAG